MAEEGRWVTVNGAHVFIKDENAQFKLQKSVREDRQRKDARSYAEWKVKTIRDFIEKTVKEINQFNNSQDRQDPENTDIGVSNSDLQAMVEAFAAENGFDSQDENRILNEIRERNK